MRDIDQALLQFIDVMNLLDSLLYISPIFRSQVGSELQICAVGWPEAC